MKRIPLLALSVLLSSCSTLITRWPARTPERFSRVEALQKKGNIFDDFLWTWPQIDTVEIQQTFSFGGHDYAFSETNGFMTMRSGSAVKTFKLKKSNKVYRDVASLELVTELKQRWIPKTEFVTQMVPVLRTRQIPITTFGAGGMPRTHFITESYTVYEARTVAITVWRWESFPEPSYRVPEVEVYDAEMPNGDRFLVYPERKNGRTSYHLQNIAYYSATQESDALFGAGDIRMVFIDAQSNGVYFEPGDSVLVSAWNPYDPGSSYRRVAKVMDNRWHSTARLEEQYFLSFKEKNGELSIIYGNEEYSGDEREGRFMIQGLEDPSATVAINGKRYRCRPGAEYPIQYGKYVVSIAVPGHVEFKAKFTVDADHERAVINFELPPEGALVRFQGIHSGDYKVSYKGETSEPQFFFSPKTIFVPVGRCGIDIDVDGFTLRKELVLRKGTETVIDFEDEITP